MKLKGSDVDIQSHTRGFTAQTHSWALLYTAQPVDFHLHQPLDMRAHTLLPALVVLAGTEALRNNKEAIPKDRESHACKLFENGMKEPACQRFLWVGDDFCLTLCISDAHHALVMQQRWRFRVSHCQGWWTAER